MAEEGKPLVFPSGQAADVLHTVAPPTVLTIAGGRVFKPTSPPSPPSDATGRGW